MESKNNAANKLIHEKSPYLLQHAHNPVQWYPWGEEAFLKARKEGRLIFLSIGYSTCHWCHVMEHESFEDKEVAEALNKNYVAIKVDREERPDIDAVYMAACQAMTGQGGWPLTILMTPGQKPVFAGTYIPKERRYGYPGLLDLLDAFAEEWKSDKGRVEKEAERIVGEVYQSKMRSVGRAPGKELIEDAVQVLKKIYDKAYGGFQDAPKFPAPHNLLFLLRAGKLTGDLYALEMAYHTLESMYRGGIYDHIGGGFSRYATDRKWLVPHFEKMLYDNALLAYVYLEAYQISGRELFGKVARSILGYVSEQLTIKEGGFCCGQDADSDGEEGRYYVFKAQEIRDVLGEEQGGIFCRWFGVSATGNFEGNNVLNLIDNKDYEETFPEIEAMRRELKKYRAGRTDLNRDDKILTSWNGMMTAAFAKAFQALGEQEYIAQAGRAEKFIRKYLTDEAGRLKIRYRDGQSVGAGQIDDYAFMAWAWLELYQADFDVSYLERAAVSVDWMIHLFWDEKDGGFFMYASDAEQLIDRPKEVYDGAAPSGNSAAAWVLVKLSHLTGKPEYIQYAKKQVAFLAGRAIEYRTGLNAGLTAVMEELYGYRELVCVTDEKDGDAPLRQILVDSGFTSLAVIVKTRENASRLESLCPYTKEYPLEKGKTAYYLCSGGACKPKVYEPGQLERMLKKEAVD